ncbi:MAG: ComF family protein [Acidobacteriaceae bacterium]
MFAVYFMATEAGKYDSGVTFVLNPKGARCAFSSQSDSLTLNLPSSQIKAWRAVVRVLRSSGDSVASVLFPADCRVCGEPLAAFSRVPVCSSCWNNLPEQSGPLCARCGESLGVSDFGVGGEPFCRPCRVAAPDFERAVAHGLYTGTLRSLLHLLKYDGLEPVAAKLGAPLATQVAAMADLPAAMLVVPVPLYKGKRRKRGFNQSELLARAVCDAMRPLRPEWRGEIAPKMLLRERETQSQAQLTARERRRNLRGVFSVPKPERLPGRDVLLIDDIYTTGATARACSLALKQAGAARVWVATVARAQRHEVQFRASRAADVPMHEDVAMWDGGNAAP